MPHLPHELVFLIVVIAVPVLVWIAKRDARAAAAARHGLLDGGLKALDTSRLSIEPSGFPKIEGTSKGRAFRVALIPDTLTFRRLPQLWLDVTLRRDLPTVRDSIAILIRPSGADYFSLTDRLPDNLMPPADFPDSCLIKGQGPGARALLNRIAPCAARLLQDIKIKEIVVSPRGIRVVRQFAQGHRGSHLILRQSVFEGAHLQAGELEDMIGAAMQIENTLTELNLVSAA
jgi:hypothetical protein